MRQLTKGIAVVAACVALAGISGCANQEEIDALKSRLDQVERTANDAKAAAARAQSTADGAADTARMAKQNADEAVESVTRMAEECCRK